MNLLDNFVRLHLILSGT